ncbi:unnamed protein product [Nesidiocoris tenuis]|nr:unnamed protein product [Nesidiocoris tenuis]
MLVPFLLAVTWSIVSFSPVNGDDFEFPPHKIELLTPTGFRVSVPDVPGATLFAVHINFNHEMEGLEAGDVAVDIIKKKNGRWTYTNKNRRLKPGDKLYYWLYLIVDKLGHRLDDQEFLITPSHLPPVEKIPDDPTTTRKPVITTPSSNILFEDDFSKGTNKWSYEVRYSDSPESDFTVWTKDFGTSGTANNQLFIRPRLLKNVANSSFVNTGTLELNGCTTRVKKNCRRTGYSWSILPPILSSRLTTKNCFSFMYGEVEVRAKLPSGDWIVPEIWLEPKEVFYGSKSGRIYIAKALGNPSLKDASNNELGQSILQQGYSLDSTNAKHSQFYRKTAKTSWTSDFHIYKFRWTQDAIQFFVDGEETGRVAVSEDSPLNSNISGSTPLAPLDRDFYVSLGLHVGGREDFPDGSTSGEHPKPWGNRRIKHTLDFWEHRGDWHPTWKSPDDRLLVDYVRVTSL